MFQNFSGAGLSLADYFLKFFRSGIILLAFVISSCAKQEFVSQPVDPALNLREIIASQHQDEGFLRFLEDTGHPPSNWPIKAWTLRELTLAAMYFNPAIKTQLAELAVYDSEIALAGQRPNPTIQLPLEHHSRDAESPWLIGLISNLLFERRSKRQARIDKARLTRQAFSTVLQQSAWDLYQGVHRQLLVYQAALREKELLVAQIQLYDEGLALLQKRLDLGQASPFELSSLRLARQQLQLQAARQDYQINNARHTLLSLTGMQANQFQAAKIEEIPVISLETARFDNISQSRDILLKNHTRIRIALKEYEALESALKVEIEKQYPDLNLSPGFIYEQGDKIWALASSWILPVFHNNDAQIARALALRRQQQYRIIALQTELLSQLNRLQQNYLDRKKLYDAALTLLEELSAREAGLTRQFELGYIDALALVRSRIETAKARSAVLSSQADLLLAIVELENIRQQPLIDGLDLTTVVRHLAEKASGDSNP